MLLKKEIEMKHIKIAAGMAECFDFGDARNIISTLDSVGADYIHADASDMKELAYQQLLGGPQIIRDIRSVTDKPIECHFYTSDIDHIFIEKLAQVGCNMLILPAEYFLGFKLANIIHHCHNLNMKIGLTLGCYTPLSFVEESIYEIDRLHLVIHGAGIPPEGEEIWTWRRSSIDMIKQARILIDKKNPKCELALDGGIRPDNLDPLVALNPDVFIFASALYKNPEGMITGFDKCRASIDKAAQKYKIE